MAVSTLNMPPYFTGYPFQGEGKTFYIQLHKIIKEEKTNRVNLINSMELIDISPTALN